MRLPGPFFLGINERQWEGVAMCSVPCLACGWYGLCGVLFWYAVAIAVAVIDGGLMTPSPLAPPCQTEG